MSPWRGNGCFDDLSLCHAICQPDSFHADHEGTFSLGRIYGFRRLCPYVWTVDTTSLNYSPLAISRSIDPLNRRIAAHFFWDKRYEEIGSKEEKLMYELLVVFFSFFFYNEVYFMMHVDINRMKRVA